MQRELSEMQPNTGDTAELFTNFHRFTECEMVPFQRKALEALAQVSAGKWNLPREAT